MVISDKSLYAPVAAGYVLGFISAFSMPVLVGSIMLGFGINEGELGVILSAEAGGLAIAAIFLSGKIARLSLRSVALAGLFITIAGHLLSTTTESYWVYVFFRTIAGIGEGLVLVAANATGAGANKPDSVFAVAQIAIGGFTMLLVGLLPFIVPEYGYRAGTFCLVAVFLLWAPVLTNFPTKMTALSYAGDHLPTPRFPHRLLGILTLFAFALMSLADVAMWIFTEQIGVNVGVSSQNAGLLLSITTGLGLFGALMAAIISDRFGRLIPIVCALLLLISANLGLGYAATPTAYGISLLPLNFAILFLTPYFLGTLAVFDKKGTWTTASGVVIPLAFATGPILAGFIVVKGSYVAVGWATGGCAAVALIIMSYVLSNQRAAISNSL